MKTRNITVCCGVATLVLLFGTGALRSRGVAQSNALQWQPKAFREAPLYESTILSFRGRLDRFTLIPHWSVGYRNPDMPIFRFAHISMLGKRLWIDGVETFEAKRLELDKMVL